MRMLSIIASATVAAILATSPALAGGWDCDTFTNMKNTGQTHAAKTQVCRNLTECPTPSMFASLSDPVTSAVRIEDTHQWTKYDRDGDIKKQSPILSGACPS